MKSLQLCQYFDYDGIPLGARDTMLDMTGLDPGAWPALCDNCLDAGGCFEGGAEKDTIINLQ